MFFHIDIHTVTHIQYIVHKTKKQRNEHVMNNLE